MIAVHHPAKAVMRAVHHPALAATMISIVAIAVAQPEAVQQIQPEEVSIAATVVAQPAALQIRQGRVT
jgi:hypothetical protein